MNFGENVLNWVLQNLQPIVLLGIAVVGIVLFVEKKMSKIVGLIVVSIVAVGFVFATDDVKDIFLQLFNSFFGGGV